MTEDTLVLRDISVECAKHEITELLRSQLSSQRLTDYGDIADCLCLELKTVVAACQELMEEGVIIFTDEEVRHTAKYISLRNQENLAEEVIVTMREDGSICFSHYDSDRLRVGLFVLSSADMRKFITKLTFQKN